MIKSARIFFLLVMFFALNSDYVYSTNSGKTEESTKPLEIVSITPSGQDVPAGQQIVIKFNRPVVPVGRMDRDESEIPVKITPKVKGQWRWLNTDSLALIMDHMSPLKLATRYSIVAKPGIKAEDGATIKQTFRHSFITERPRISWAGFKIWEAPGIPVLQVNFNQPVLKNTIERHLYLKTRDNIRIRVKAKPDTGRINTGMVFRLPGEKTVSIKSPDLSAKKEKTVARNLWLIYPEDELALDADVELVVEPGIKSNTGPESGVENRVATSFHTFPEFTFLGVRCQDERGGVFIKPDNNQGICDPGTVNLEFSSPVFNSEVRENSKIEPGQSLKSEDNIYQEYQQIDWFYRNPHRAGSTYMVPVPQILEPNRVYKLKIGPGELSDMFGRVLKDPVDMPIPVGHLPSGYIISRQPEVFEKNSNSELPIIVTNLEKLAFKYDRLTAGGMDNSLNLKISASETRDEAISTPVPVRRMLDGRSGVVHGSVSSIPTPGRRFRWRNNIFNAQVTPFHVHAKLSYFDTMVWVTDLETGKPVNGARVKIYMNYNYDTFNVPANPQILSHGLTDKDGLATLDGAEKIDPELKSSIYFGEQNTIMIQVEKGEDVALLPMNYDFLIYSAFGGSQNCFIRTWGTTAQGVYKPGGTVQYKVYVRDQNSRRFIAAPKSGYVLNVFDPMNKSVHEVKDITLSDFGTIEGEFDVPVTGTTGWYRFELSASFTENKFCPMSVLVSDFTPAPFSVETEINKKYFKPDDMLRINTKARLHDGGPYTGASTRVSAILNNQSSYGFFPPDSEAADGFFFSNSNNNQEILSQEESVLDEKGDLVTKIKIPESNIIFGEIFIESAVRDDRGKYTAESKTAKYSARDRFVGLKVDNSRTNKDEPLKIQILAVDEEGKPVSGIPVNILVEHEEITVMDVKNQWNATIKRYSKEWKTYEEQKLESTVKPLEFAFKPEKPGYFRITATVRDSKGREHSTQIMQNTYWRYWNRNVIKELNTLEIIPDKTSYKVGDTARYQVKNPFHKAKALVSIERNGVIKHWFQTFDKKESVIEVKIEEDYIPGFYLSVVLMSPESESIGGNDQKKGSYPSVTSGYALTEVNDVHKKITIHVNTDKKVYKPGENVKIDLNAEPERGDLTEPVELSVVVINEEVLALLSEGIDYFDPYKGFYKLGPLDMVNFNLLKRLINYNAENMDQLKGPQGTLYARARSPEQDEFTLEEITVNAEKKEAEMDRISAEKSPFSVAEAHGSGENNSPEIRADFKFVSYWNPSIITDKHGNATVEFKAPDDLTGWRVLVMAVTPTDKMGLGEGEFAVNRDTEMRPVMPNQVTEGDSFKAGFSIMNRTDKTRELTVTITAEGAIETDKKHDTQQVTQRLTAEPYKRISVWLPVKSKGPGTIRFTATGGDAADRDGVVHQIEVHKMASLQTASTYGTSVEGIIKESLLFPEDIRTDVGFVKVNLSPTVIGQVEGAFKYLRDYPYLCWEQRLTKGVMAAHYMNLKKYMPDDFVWEEAESITKLTLENAAGFQAPNGGMTYYIPQDQYVSPYLSAYTALAFTWLKDRGYEIPSDVKDKLNKYLKNYIGNKEKPSFYTEGMASTVRAVALAALARQDKITIDDIKQYHSHIKEMDLFGKAHFLMAALEVPGTEEIRKEVFDIILSHSNRSGGKFVFNEPFDDGYSRILTSTLRTNAAALSSFIAYGKTKEGKERVGDIPFKMVRYITQTRKQSGRWENTQENMFCMNALIEYSKAYETVVPDMDITAMLGKEILGKAEFKDVRDEPVELKRPIQNGDAGRKTEVTIERKGKGRLYYSAGLKYAPVKLNTNSINAGIEVKREYSVERNGEWILLKSPMQIKRGELVRVDLFVSIPTARNFVVVDDPVPGGLEPVNSDLATSSQVDADKGAYKPAGGSWWFQYGDWSYYGRSRWSFYHRELRHDAARFYSEYLSAGNYHLSYTAQAISSGEFTVMPTHAEEMYDPDVFGKSYAGILKVKMEE